MTTHATPTPATPVNHKAPVGKMTDAARIAEDERLAKQRAEKEVEIDRKRQNDIPHPNPSGN